jgi:hypothetical protein
LKTILLSHRVHVRRISKFIFWLKLLLCKIQNLYYRRNSKNSSRAFMLW